MMRSIAKYPWPSDVSFIPFVGEQYHQGMAGHRVLLLGESHYRNEGATSSPEITRQFTIDEFSGMASPDRKPRFGGYYDAVDRILLQRESYSADEAASAWRRISFVNLSQEFTRDEDARRPTPNALQKGSDILKIRILPVLRPTVILVLGKKAWDGLSHGTKSDLAPYSALHVNRHGGARKYAAQREVWLLEFDGGAAWMTWVYHPSWHIDHWSDRAGALQHLLKLPTAPSRDQP